MPEGGKINTRQAIGLMVTMVLPTAFLFVTSVTGHLAKQDGWISLLLSILTALLIGWVAVNLSLRFPGKTLFQYVEVILGRWPGKFVAFLYVLWYIHINALIIREYGSFLVAAFMPETPISVFMLLILAISAYAVRNGLEVFTRVNEIILPLILVTVIVTSALATPEMDLKRMLPVYVENGPVPIVKAAFMPAAWMSEIVMLAVLSPYLNKIKDGYKIAATSTLITGTFLIISFVAGIATFGPEVIAGWLFPALNNARVIHLANFLERLEVTVMVVWVAGALVKISVFYWAAVLGSAQWLELKDYRPLVLPVGIILFATAIMLHDSILDLFVFLGTAWPPFALTTFQGGFFFLLLAAAIIRGKVGKRK